MFERKKPSELRLFIVNTSIIVIAVCLFSVVCLTTVANDIQNSHMFSSNIVIDGVRLSGMTFLEAKVVLEERFLENISAISVKLKYENQVFSLNGSELGFESNIEEVLQSATEIGKQDSPLSQDTAVSTHTLNTKLTINIDALKQNIENACAQVNKDAKNAVAEFNEKTRRFTFKDGTNGIRLEAEQTANALSKRLCDGDFTEFSLITSNYEPNYTLSELKANTVKIAEFSSKTSNNFNRNTNIQLMCSYVNGYMLQPNEILSINELVGKRTAEKGFLPAPAIMDGKRLENDLGGGICQLSGTLYNAVLWANLNIVERWPHSWPSNYLEIGLDSTLDWNTEKDLKVQNMSDYPIYFAAWLDNGNLASANTLRIEVYGQPLPKGVTIDIRSEILETFEPQPDYKKYVSTLSPGQRKVIIVARTGYRTCVWRDFYYNGNLIDSEIVGTSYYRPIQGEVEIGRNPESSKKPEATVEPTRAPEPTDEPEPTPTVVPLEPQPETPGSEP
ncbi:MAG: hypothetical protein GX802_05415 [Clostridiales bacterium]|nr:hypothetical protein [Clostridiales bacterium]